MSENCDIEKSIKENRKRNEKYIAGFKKWLIEKGLSVTTIRKHLGNVELYINNYLNYYDVIKAEDGIGDIYEFIDGWFIKKCLWVKENSIKEMVASLKKFYQYMSENNYVSVEDYKDMCNFIKESMDDFFESLDAFDTGTYYSMF